MTTLTSNAQKFQCLVVIHANYSVAFSKLVIACTGIFKDLPQQFSVQVVFQPLAGELVCIRLSFRNIQPIVFVQNDLGFLQLEGVKMLV